MKYNDEIEFKGELKGLFRNLKKKMEVKDVFMNGQGKELAVAVGSLILAGTSDMDEYEWYILLDLCMIYVKNNVLPIVAYLH